MVHHASPRDNSLPLHSFKERSYHSSDPASSDLISNDLISSELKTHRFGVTKNDKVIRSSHYADSVRILAGKIQSQP